MSAKIKRPYDVVTVVLHWLVAALVFGLFALGLYIVELTYYDPWYRMAPDVHKGIGVVLFLLVLFRLAWRLRQRQRHSGSNWQRQAARVVQALLYVLLIAVPLSGYFISTADGRPLEVFGWFSIPSLVSSFENLEDIAGATHQLLAYALVGIALAHAGAAFNHHFITKDDTLRNMLGLDPRSRP